MRIIDSHVHFWDNKSLDYDWLASLPDLNIPRLPSHFPTDIAQLAGVIVIQADCHPEQALDEVKWINQQAINSPFRIAGIVAWAPLEQGNNLMTYLDKLSHFKNVIGIRRPLQNESDTLFYDEQYRLGLLTAAKAGYTVDICIRARQLPALQSLLSWLFNQFPKARVVLNHMAKPEVINQELTTWKQALYEIAKFDRLWCKISGLPTEADWLSWKEQDLAPYIQNCLTIFGPQRCLFGSDWPVVNLAGGYSRWKQCVENILSTLPEKAQKAVWHDNAYAAYSIPLVEK